jgi:5-methylcytosine-specific restriction protein A
MPSTEHLQRMRNRRADLLRTRSDAVRAELVLVTGPPCSGKSTFVDEHRAPGDVVVDLDRLAVALGSPDTHDHPQHVLEVATAAWVAALAASRRTAGRVWLVRVSPTAGDRAAATRIVELAVPAEVCKQRAVAAGRPEGWSDVIDAWWARRDTRP